MNLNRLCISFRITRITSFIFVVLLSLTRTQAAKSRVLLAESRVGSPMPCSLLVNGAVAETINGVLTETLDAVEDSSKLLTVSSQSTLPSFILRSQNTLCYWFFSIRACSLHKTAAFSFLSFASASCKHSPCNEVIAIACMDKKIGAQRRGTDLIFSESSHIEWLIYSLP